MTQYQLTVDSESLQRLFGENEQVARLLEQVLNQVLEAQVGEHLHANPYERTEERQGYRNGYKPRQLTTRVGTLNLRVPQVRDGSFSPDLFARYQRSEQALVCTLMEMVVNGVSTRKVAQITEELCGKAFSKSTVSDLCQGLDPLVSAWNERSLAEQRYPFVLVDALVLKIREEGRVRARSALLAIGVNEVGYREILGMQLGDSESERSWMEYFVWLKGRGLAGVDLVVSDHHGGLVNAVRLQFQGAPRRGPAPGAGDLRGPRHRDGTRTPREVQRRLRAERSRRRRHARAWLRRRHRRPGLARTLSPAPAHDQRRRATQ